MESSAATQILGSDATISDKIRALDAAGYPRAEIARLLGKRYQHVRNVLEADKLVRKASLAGGVAEPARRFESPRPEREVEDRGGGAYRLVVREDGSVVLPPAILEAFGVHGRGVVMARLEGEEFKLCSTATAWRRIQEMVRPYIKDGESWADSLIADRRREAAQEESDG